MALTRRGLKAMGIDEEKIDEIIAMHTEVVDGLKEQVKTFKADAEAATEIQKKLDEANASLESASKSSWKVKYEALKEDFESYKNEQSAKETRVAKESAYRELLKAAGVSEKRIAAILKVSDIDSIELDDAGKIKDSENLTKSIKEEWADFIQTSTQKGAETPKPPSTVKGKESFDSLSLADKMKYANEHPQEVAGWFTK